MSLRPVILQNLMRAATARKVKASTGSDLLHRVRTKGTALSSAERAADELAQGFVAMEETAAAANYFFGQGDFEESGAALDDVIAWAKALKSDLGTYSKLDVDMGEEDIEAASARKVTAKARVTGKVLDGQGIIDAMESELDVVDAAIDAVDTSTLTEYADEMEEAIQEGTISSQGSGKAGIWARYAGSIYARLEAIRTDTIGAMRSMLDDTEVLR